MRREGRAVDPLDVIEAAYHLDCDEETWLKGILERFGPAVEDGGGALAYLYDAAARPLRVWGLVGEIQPTYEDIVGVIHSADDEYVAQSYLVTPFGAASEAPGFDRQVTFGRRLGPYGIRDAVAMNAFDTSGLGAWFGALLPSKTIVHEGERDRWSKVAAHITAAMRLRKRLSAPQPVTAEAVLSPTGKLEHAEGEVANERSALSLAVRRLERARGALRHSAPGDAIETWTVLVRAQWTLVDQFESDGRRFVLAYQNAARSRGPLAFTPREREVVALATLGHAPKLIAYELGLAPSTVRVHLTNASRKLGVRTLKGLISKYRAWLLQAPAEPDTPDHDGDATEVRSVSD